MTYSSSSQERQIPGTYDHDLQYQVDHAAGCELYRVHDLDHALDRRGETDRSLVCITRMVADHVACVMV